MKRALAFLLLSPLAGSLTAAVELPSIFSDHMVLQQGAKVPVFGKAAPGEAVKVTFAGQEVSTKADAEGRWKVELAALKANSQPGELRVTGTNTIVISDVLVGEVWVCAGQSNMAAVQRGMVSKEVAERKEIRFFISDRLSHYSPQEQTKGKWSICHNGDLREYPYSAVGYFFAREIHQATAAPVGMIQSAWGGTSIQPWITLAAFDQSDSFRKLAEQVKARQSKLPELMAKYENETLPAWQTKHAEWKAKFSAPKPAAGENDDAPETEPAAKTEKPGAEPKRPAAPGGDGTAPASIYNGMIFPHIPYAIKGVVWYQGESNTQNDERSREYADLMGLLIKGWRDAWGQGEFPFLFVQLPAFEVQKRSWALLRNSQFKALAVPNTGMAIALDLNPTNNLHPPNKEEVGRRLALLARKMSYGENLVASGPLYRSMKIEGNKVRISFTEVGSGLTLGEPPPAYKPKTVNPESAGKLLGFEIAGEEGDFVPANAEISGQDVLVWSDAVAKPARVAYAWASHPQANLYNKEGLPASPFRTDDAPSFAGGK